MADLGRGKLSGVSGRGGLGGAQAGGGVGVAGWAGPPPKAPNLGWGAGGGAGAGGAAAPGPPPLTGWQGSPSTWMQGTYDAANKLAGSVPDMLQRNLTQARDIGSSAMKEYQTGLTGRLGPGGTAPGAAARIGRETAMNMNKGALDAQNQQFSQQLGANQLAGQMGQGISSDLRGQEGSGINAYRASTDAWAAGQQAEIARMRASLDAQIAAMNAMLGMGGSGGSGGYTGTGGGIGAYAGAR